MSSEARMQVVVAGGGVAGVEALLALRDLAGERVELTLVEPESEFVFRPMAVAETFARGRGERVRMSRIASDAGAALVHARLTGVDEEHGLALVDDGEPLPFDALLVAVGAGSEPAYRGAITWTPEADPEIFGGLRRDLEEGYAKSVAFVVPPGVAWPLPAYELALMTAWSTDSMAQDDIDIRIVTPEQAPLGLFGPAGSEAVRADLADAGVIVETGSYVEEQGDPPTLAVQPGARQLEARHVVALPRPIAPPLSGLPTDSSGFIKVDQHCRAVGSDRVWAAGDAVDFPIKQGGLAAQQADAAAQGIAKLAGVELEPRPFRPVLRGVLLTGRGRQWMRSKIAGGGGEADAARNALWWPPTKVAGRYLAPYLQALAQAGDSHPEPPPGKPVELDLDEELVETR
jgi:sulfide:quinone oxidoreductase